MNIMVIDVPAETSGALTILKDFHTEVINHPNKKINWYFVISTPKLEEDKNVKILRYPWVKKSWAHRYYFDQKVVKQIIKKYKIDYVFSLQNVVVENIQCKQTLYLHQPLPFVGKKYGFLEKPKFWIYQNIISKKIFNSIKMSSLVIVQTQWMKNAVIEKTAISEKNIKIVKPKIEVLSKSKEIKVENNNDDKITFFYPATEFPYKNHTVIIDAVKSLLQVGTFNKQLEVIFTINGKENRYTEKLKNDVVKNDLPIRFVGKLSKEEVYELYSTSTLLFPSYIETFGLPLLEGRVNNAIILAADMPFSKEIIGDYENGYFFNYDNSKQLSDLMGKVVNKEIVKKTIREFKLDNQKESLVEVVLNSFKIYI